MTGCSIQQAGEGTFVIHVLDHSPAADAGITAGDAILAVDGKGTNGLEINDVLERIRGKPGSEVALTVRNHETGVVLNFTVKRVSSRAFHAANP